MKLSLAWIFDHLSVNWQDYNISLLLDRLGKTVAEIESAQLVTYNPHNFTLFTVTRIAEQEIYGFCPEYNQEIALSFRADCWIGHHYLIKRGDENIQTYQWADGADFHSTKLGLLPAVQVTPAELQGSWKQTFEQQDWILTFENKSLTHRPDLWSHRGFARECAAILGVKLIDERQLLAHIPVHHYEQSSPDYPHALSVSLETPACTRLAALEISSVSYTPSLLWMAHRLLRVDARPLNVLVDTTNYVMFDIGQPMHAFDAQTITKKIVATMGNYESLTLLDGQTIQVTQNDCIMSDGIQPLSLAGIMGGQATGVTLETHSLIIEAGCFNATTIRKSSAHFKKRSESSMRFEKSLDPAQVTKALARYVKLLECNQVAHHVASPMMVVGSVLPEKIIAVEHAYLEKKIGIELEHARVEKILKSLEFGVKTCNNHGSVIYHIQVPSIRATKDIEQPCDIVEEIARYIGLDHLPATIPALPVHPTSMHELMALRYIKDFCAFSLPSHEVRNYALYDQHFLQQLGWSAHDAVSIKNPVSEHFSQLVTSLVPHLLKNIAHNYLHQQTLTMFECNKIWLHDHHIPQEHKSLAVVWYGAQELNFYAIKDKIEQLFKSLSLTVLWKKAEHVAAWYHPYKTAAIMLNNQVIGHYGVANPAFLKPLGFEHALIMECMLEKILEKAQAHTFKPLSKFPETWFDISLMIPVLITVAEIESAIKKADERIFSVMLVDFFQKADWIDQRSITMRFYARDEHRTLTKEDIDHIYTKVVEHVTHCGATVR